MSGSDIDAGALKEIQSWDVFDANVRVGRSGMHGELALETDALLAEMNHFSIKRALVSHFTAEEYDAEEGNRALARDLAPRLVPAWAALPDKDFISQLSSHKPKAARLFFSAQKHNFPSARWGAGELYEYLAAEGILTVISREDIDWNSLALLLENFPRLTVLLLEPGYRADRYLFQLLKRHPNLYFDTSTYLAHRQLERYVELFGHDRVVFGSRLPLYTPGASLAVLATARISDQASAAIAGGTLSRLLRIDPA